MTVSLVPAPVSVREGTGAPFRLAPDVAITGEAAAVAVLTHLIAVRTAAAPAESPAIPRERMPEPGVPAGVAAAAAASAETGGHVAARIDLHVTPGGAAESYRLTVHAASVTVVGADAAGLFYGVQTLAQLIARRGDGWVIPAVDIDDAPRFRYRGAMLDVARHFFPVETVTAYIDRAAGLKLNHLHLHLTDDQGWRLQLRSRPALTDAASSTGVGGDGGGFYTADDYRAIVAYAASRHMTVVPEIDMPGHTHAVGLAYPEIAEAPVITDDVREAVRTHGGSIPAPGEPFTGMAVGFSSLKIFDEGTYAFLADVLSEVASLTPGPFLHLGGDECRGTDPGDFAVFVARATELVASIGKTPVMWHEAGAARGLAPGTVGQYWGAVIPGGGADEHARGFVTGGGAVILSPSDAVYLDMKPEPDSPLGLIWANGPTTAARAYDWEPLEVLAGLDERDILGVEAPMWTETIRTLADIDAMAFPRIAAAAEIAWSPARGASDARTWESFRERVGGLGPLWSALGIGFLPLAEIPWSTA